MTMYRRVLANNDLLSKLQWKWFVLQLEVVSFVYLQIEWLGLTKPDKQGGPSQLLPFIVLVAAVAARLDRGGCRAWRRIGWHRLHR